MPTTLNWHVDAITKDIHFDGVISARDLYSLNLTGGTAKATSANQRNRR